MRETDDDDVEVTAKKRENSLKKIDHKKAKSSKKEPMNLANCR